MTKNKELQENSGQKVQTRYDRRMEARKKQEAKDKMESRIMRIGAVTVGLVLIAAIGGSIIVSAMNKKAVTSDTYVTVGSHDLTKLEYDYYYNTALNSYAAYLSYLVDTTKDLDEQQYSDELTWKDFFDQTAVEQIKQTKALADDAAATGFTYDDTEDYKNMTDQIAAGAESAGQTVSDYYKALYGTYATQNNMERFIKEGLLAGAYYEHLQEQNKPSEEEIDAYYAENVLDYDKVDYRSFIFTADVAEGAAEEDIAKAMEAAKDKADAMMAARQGGKDFKELCLENATEENKAVYEDAETDASLTTGAYYYAVPAEAAGWLYEDGRAEGDITVVEDIANHQYYVVEFVSRYYDEADDEAISSTLASERATEYLNGLAEGYEVTDRKGELKFLTVDAAAIESAVETIAEENTSGTMAEETE